jgi:hypothetical protein
MPTYGPHNISIDGHSVAGNAHSQNVSFQQLLGGQSGLTNGPHTAVLTNTGTNSPIDLDSIVFETQIGSVKCVFTPLVCVIDRTVVPSSTITAMTIDDKSPEITYLPTADWDVLQGQSWFDDTLQYAPHSLAFSPLC